MTIISVSASDNIFKITNTAFVDASQDIQQDFYTTDEASIAQELLFHKVGDYAKYKVTFNNSDSTDHTIESITDDNQNNNISLEYDDYSGTQVNAGNSFDFILTVKYISAVDSLAERDQFSTVKLYIKYKDVEKSDEIDIDPATPETLDTLNISIIVLIISGIGLVVLIVLSTKSSHKKTQTIAVILAVAIPLFISVNAIAISEGTDTVILSSEFGLYDKLAITLDVNGVEKTITVDYNSAVDNITNPEAPEGYEFDTWKDESGNPVSGDTKLTEDTKLFASFKAKTYSISYTGTETSEEQGLPTEYTIETSVSIDALPNRKDADEDETQAFAGWKAEDDTISNTITIPTGQTGDRSFEATWTPVAPTEYTIAYNYNGGSAENTTKFTKFESVSVNNPTRNDYTFAGWSSSDIIISNPMSVTIPIGTRKNVTLNAAWTPVEFDIIYDGLTEAEITNLGLTEKYTIETGSISLTTPNDRSEEDEHFKSWSSTDVNVDDPSNVSLAGKSGNITIKANWGANTHYIEYVLNNGTNPDTNPSSFTKNELPLSISQPTREHYTFAGWTSDELNITTPTQNVTIPSGIKDNVTLTANWTPVTYNIYYDGTTTSEETNLPKNYDIEHSVTIPELGDRFDDDEDKTAEFIGWKAQSETTTSKTATIPVGSSGGKTYTAIWNPVDYPTYTIAYELNGATTDPGNKTTYQKTDADYTLDNPEKTGYTFDGWTCDQLGIKSPTTALTILHGTRGDLTIVANFTINTYNISYAGLESEEEQDLPTSYTINDAVNIPALNDRADSDGDIIQTFLGWSDGSSSSPASTISFSNETGDKSYEAKWQNEAYPPVRHITYNLDGGSASNPDTYTKQDSDFTLNEPTKTGYTFTGWSGSKITGEDNMSVTIDTAWNKDLSYTAHYSPIQYTINFDVNFENTDDSDTATMDSKTFTYGIKESLPANTFDVEGYTFTGWKDANDTEYLDQAEIENLCNTAGCSVTLYAQWTPNTNTRYNIELYFENVNDDNYTLDDTETKHETGTTGEQTDVIDFDEPSYSFTGFSYDHGDPASLQATIDRHGNTVIKLYYKRNRYDVTFNANGGKISGTDSETTTVTKKYGATIALSEFPELTAKQYADFAGWYTTADDSGELISSSITVDRTRTIYAHWTIPTLCKKATELHVETCINSSGGCSKNQYSVDGGSIVGKKNTSTIVYGKISDGNSFEIGDALDCDVNGDGEYNATSERFYYIRDDNNKAVLVYSSNFEGDHVGTTEFYNYGPALTKLPTTEYWGGLERIGVAYHDNKVARLLNEEDTVALFGGTGRSITTPFENDFVFENTGYYYYDTPASEEVVKPAMWTEIEKATNVHYRIHTNQLVFNDKADNSSNNVVRPVIEVPMVLMDQSPAETVTITFNAMGGEAVPQLTIGKGNAFRSRVTTTRTLYTFKGWCFDEGCTSEVSYSTIIDRDVTLYANWELIDAAASVGGEYYGTLAEAIEAVPTTGVETEVVLLKNITENTIDIENGRNVLLNGGSYTLTASKGNAIRLKTGSKLTLASGTITSKQKDGVINVNEGTELVVRGGKIKATGQRGTIFVNGGTVSIYDGEISSTSNERATIHNLCRSDLSPQPQCNNPGTINIYGGSVESTGAYAIFNERGTLNIGIKNETADETADTSNPIIRAKTYGIIAHETTSNGVNFYDGTIAGKTAPTASYNGGSTYNPSSVNQDPNQAIITDIESGYDKQVTTDGDGYKNLTLTLVSP